jgi:hypothetical protein
MLLLISPLTCVKIKTMIVGFNQSLLDTFRGHNDIDFQPNEKHNYNAIIQE